MIVSNLGNLENIEKIKNNVATVMIEAGEILMANFGKKLSWQDKKDMGFVTEVDLKSEKFLKKNLAEILPGASFWAEESGIEDNNSPYYWVIDPLDGTTNFAHAIPYFCISVALTYKGEPILGFIYNPIMKEMFFAQKDNGAFFNDTPMQVSKVESFDKAFLAVCIPYERSSDYYKRFISSMSEIIKGTFAFRHCGAAALDLVYTAAGRYDAVFFENLFWWDFAAGSLLIREAGGLATDFANEPIDHNSKSILGANKVIHAKLLAIFNKHK